MRSLRAIFRNVNTKSRIATFVAVPLVVVCFAPASAWAQQAEISALSKPFQDFYAAGKYSDALAESQKLEGYVKTRFGTNHTAYATALYNLALVYASQARFGEAEGFCRRALAIREQILGASHPEIASTLNQLAGIYAHQGKYGEAEGLYQRVLAIREQTLH